jgi:glyoxalase superfamily protein
MSTPFQIAIDAADPHALNRFWSAAMGYEMEDHHDLVKQLLDSGQVTPDETIELDGRLAFKTAAASRDPEGVAPRLLFQTVPEPKTVKNRVHLDLHVGDERRENEVERLIALGASRLWDGQQGPNRWVTMADPEGNEFCVA